MSQAAKAQALLDLHTNGKLLILPNVWNPIGARMLEGKGFSAVATASAAIAESLGYGDGEQIKLETMLEMVGRIVSSVNLPVSADFEAGYSDSITGLQENISRLIDTGAVGINFEDGLDDSSRLRPIDGTSRADSSSARSSRKTRRASRHQRPRRQFLRRWLLLRRRPNRRRHHPLKCLYPSRGRQYLPHRARRQRDADDITQTNQRTDQCTRHSKDRQPERTSGTWHQPRQFRTVYLPLSAGKNVCYAR
jgi:hypothetical protein